MKNNKAPLCKCGCGKHVKRSWRPFRKWNEFLNSHNVRNSKTRKKISKTLIGRKLPEETRKKMSEAGKIKIFSTEHRKNLSKTIKKLFENPENHPNWKGGISFEIYPREFKKVRENIRERDNHTCQLCGKTEKQNGKKLCAHHINYDKKNCNPKNLISLCHICNIEVNYDREIWTRVFQNMIEIQK